MIHSFTVKTVHLTIAAILTLAGMPNPVLTPGSVAVSDPSVVCRYGEASRERNVPYSVRDRVYLAYGIPRGQRKGLYRIDHLIPLELGGSNDPKNLWPQTYQDSIAKDRVENELHHEVCSGQRSLASAQQAIARDWHSAALWGRSRDIWRIP